MSNQEVELVIVGSGPAGYTAAGTGCAAAQDAQHYLSNLAPASVSEPVPEVSA